MLRLYCRLQQSATSFCACNKIFRPGVWWRNYKSFSSRTASNKTYSQKHNTKELLSSILPGASAVAIFVVMGYTWWKYKQRYFQVVATDTDHAGKLEGDDSSAEKKQNSVPCKILSLSQAISLSRDWVQRIKDEVGSPGLVIGVSINGKDIWKEGLGYADVENRVPCSADTVMRIASISKPITMTAAAKLLESGELDLDLPIQHYVPTFPEKMFEGKKVTITTRQLASHLGGIRHYSKTKSKETKRDQDSDKVKDTDKENKEKEQSNDEANEFVLKEYLIKDKYKNVTEALKLFQDDPLLNKPGSEFLYTTHGWTLISAVIEAAAKKPFQKVAKELFRDLGLQNTYLDENEPLIYNRSKNYSKNKTGRLVNAPYVDNSYKWAGGGFLSTVGDLCKFGNAMLFSFQQGKQRTSDTSSGSTGYLKQETVQLLWSPVPATFEKGTDHKYGLGWMVAEDERKKAFCKERAFEVCHTGGAIGASSVLFILPAKCGKQIDNPPQGVVVAIIVNMQRVGLQRTALEIAKIFEQVDPNSL